MPQIYKKISGFEHPKTKKMRDFLCISGVTDAQHPSTLNLEF